MRTLLFVITLVTCIFDSKAQETFKSLMKYDIKGISVNDKLICPLNGFNHGTVDYGVYKQRGFYFAVTLDNAVLGHSISIFETIDFENIDNLKKKGMKCTLKQLGDVDCQTYNCSFVELKEDGIIYLSMTGKVNNQDISLTYIMVPQNKQ